MESLYQITFFVIKKCKEKVEIQEVIMRKILYLIS